MDKRHLHHVWTRVRGIKTLYFLVVAVVSTIVCVFALRANNLHMLKLKEAVFKADANNTDIQKPLRELQQYVTTHMNTNLSSKTTVYPPIQLKNTYSRLVKAQGDQTAQANAQLYNEAQHVCEQQNSTDISGRNRVPCIEKYVQEHTTAQTHTIPDALYKFDFFTPSWSPDLAGWSMVVGVISWLLTIGCFLVRRWFKRRLA